MVETGASYSRVGHCDPRSNTSIAAFLCRLAYGGFRGSKGSEGEQGRVRGIEVCEYLKEDLGGESFKSRGSWMNG